MRVVELRGPTQLSGICMKTFPHPGREIDI